MKIRSEYPQVRLPKKIDQLLYILSQELKNNKVFDSLADVGFDDSQGRSDFTFMILDIIFKEAPDELANVYLTLLIKHTKKLKDTERTSITKQAFKFYIDLMVEKKKRSELRKNNN